MSDEISKLSKRYRNRKIQLIFYILGFIIGLVILIIIGNNYQIAHFVLISFLVLCGLAISLFLVYSFLKLLTGEKLSKSVKNHLVDWQYESIMEVISQIKTDTPLTIERITAVTQEILLKDLRRKYLDLNVQGITISPQETVNIIKRILAKNPSLGVFYQVENIFVKQIKEPIKLDTKPKVTCFYCGSPMQINQEICYYCQENSLKCSVCKLTINFGDAVGQCTLCDAKGHLIHMQEWVKTQGKCPVCLQALSIEGIVPEEIHKAKKK